MRPHKGVRIESDEPFRRRIILYMAPVAGAMRAIDRGGVRARRNTAQKIAELRPGERLGDGRVALRPLSMAPRRLMRTENLMVEKECRHQWLDGGGYAP